MADHTYESLLVSWTEAYEKAIVDTKGRGAKSLIDKACCNAVDDLTQRLYDKGYGIPKEDLEITTSRRFETMKEAIEHHIENLTKGGAFNQDQTLNIEITQENIAQITVKNCTYQEGCQWALGQEHFDPMKGQYRCQRLGCFVGAVKKYLKEDKLPEGKIEKLSYVMTKIMLEQEDAECFCQGFVFVNENLMGEKLLQDNPPQFRQIQS